MKVVGIHGIRHDYMTAPEIEHPWLLAIQGGLEEAGEPKIKSTDFTVAAYGSLFRPSGTRSADIPPISYENTTEWEQKLLLEWWHEAANLSKVNRREKDELGEDETIQDPDIQGRGNLIINHVSKSEFVQTVLRQLSKSKYFKALVDYRDFNSTLMFYLRQVSQYLYDQDLKHKILQRVTAKVSKDTRVIVGHSLGSVVAYEALCANPEWNVHTLVTLGSPLGIHNLIFDALTPSPENGQGVWPNVKQWFNIADKGDIVALEKELAPYFGSVTDQLVNNGWESHDVRRYLNAKETGRAIAKGLFE
jgi:hypothetical protein